MLKTLVSLNADLASSIALRYTCQLANMLPMDLQMIHVQQPDHDGHPPGTGWVRRTWERGLLHTAREDIMRLITAERTSYPGLIPPKICLGDREEEVLRELRDGDYDLFVEGALYSFTSAGFYKKLRSRLYRQIPCPVILVKNLVSPRRVVLLFGENVETHGLIETSLSILEGAAVEIDLFRLEFSEARAPDLAGRPKKALVLPGSGADRLLEQAWKLMEAGGRSANRAGVVRDTPDNIGDALRDYGLVVCGLSRRLDRKNPMLALMSRVPSAILLCWQ